MKGEKSDICLSNTYKSVTREEPSAESKFLAVLLVDGGVRRDGGDVVTRVHCWKFSGTNNDPERAIAAFQQAIRLAPDFIEPRCDLACLLMAGPEKTAAIQWFTDLVKIAPGHANAWVNLGVLRDGNGDTRGAETACQNALAAQPANGIAHLNLALIKARQRQPDEALRHMAQTVASGMDTARGRHQLGEVFRNHGDPVRARQQFEYALQLDPRNADAHNDLGVLLGAAGDHAGALTHFQQAVAPAPDHPRAAKNLEHAKSMLKPK